MMAVPDRELEDPWRQELQRLQQRVDDCGDYAGRVEFAKASWQSKSPRLFGDLKIKLAGMCSGNRRCSYCEDSIADEIEHMRPKDLYPQETYVWRNYVLACGPCNGPKNNRFAVLDESGEMIDISRKRNAPVVTPMTGSHALVDPRIEDPIDFLWLDFRTWRYVPNFDDENSIGWKRAEYTIDILRLNARDDLVRGRRAAFSGYESRLRAWIAHHIEWDVERQASFIEDFRAERYRGVWERMKRHRAVLGGFAALLEAAPEAVNW